MDKIKTQLIKLFEWFMEALDELTDVDFEYIEGRHRNRKTDPKINKDLSE